jgi:hypothetical protein
MSTLPTDFTPPSLSPKDPYVDQTYQWVITHYDGTKHLHHLALLVAIIAASSILPFLFLPKDSRPLFANADSPQRVREIYAQLDWEERKKKGQKDKAIFIGMFTGFIIALYEPQSPLRKHMALSDNFALGEPWTAKHSQPFLFFLSFFFTYLFSPLLFLLKKAVKGVSYSTLIRLGVLWGKGLGACDKGTFGKTWGCHHPKIISTMYHNLKSILDSNDPYVPYDTLSFLIGEKGATFFSTKDIPFDCRPPLIPTPSIHSSHSLDQLVDI